MIRLSYDRYGAEIIAQTDLLRSSIKGADMTTPVPSCPAGTSASCCGISAAPRA